MSFFLPLLLAFQTLLAAPLSPALPTEEPAPAAEIAEESAEPRYDLPRVYVEGGSISCVWEYEPVTIRMEDIYGRTVLEDDGAQWRSHGNSTISKPKRPYKIKLSRSQSLFGMDESRRFILLANAFDKSLLRNRLALELAQALEIPYTSDSCFVDVYLNGDYRGNYLMVESVRVGPKQVNIHPAANEYLLEVLMGTRKSDGVTYHTPVKNIILELSGMDSLDPAQEAWLDDFFTHAENALLTGDEEKIGAYFDIDSFVRVYLLNEYSKNPDTAFASSRFYIKGGRLYAGPPWDYDLAFGDDISPSKDKLHWHNLTCPGQTYGWYATTLWWNELCQLDWFQLRFAALFEEMQPVLLNLYEDNELGQNRLDALTEEMAQSIARNFERWSIQAVYSRQERMPGRSYESNLEFLRTWLKARNEWILSQLNDSGDFIAVTTP